jgi:mono/diheme cytochrome c family protein
MHLVHLGILLNVVMGMAACSLTSPASVSAQLSRGESVYIQGCAIVFCHGIDGEGIRNDDHFRVWPMVGSEFQHRNPNAQVVFDVVRSGAEPSLRALTDQQIYDAIAYELSLNGVELSEPLVAQNAFVVSSGVASEEQKAGTLFPPPGNSTLVSSWVAPMLPVSAENKALNMRVTQIGLSLSIDSMAPPAGGSYLLVVFTLEDLNKQPIEVGPQYLSLVTKGGNILEPLDINLDYPVTRLHPQTIEYEHGIVALAIFNLPESSQIDHLLYTWPSDQPLVLYLSY